MPASPASELSRIKISLTAPRYDACPPSAEIANSGLRKSRRRRRSARNNPEHRTDRHGQQAAALPRWLVARRDQQPHRRQHQCRPHHVVVEISGSTSRPPTNASGIEPSANGQNAEGAGPFLGHHRRHPVRALYGGVATPSEAAGVGALFCLLLVAVIYRMWQPDKMWHIFRDSTRESVMIMMIIATSELFGYMMSSLNVRPESLRDRTA